MRAKLTNKEIIGILGRVFDKLDNIDSKIDKHGENISALLIQTKSTQKELTEHKYKHEAPLKEHKEGHKWWVTLTLTGAGLVTAVIGFILRG